MLVAVIHFDGEGAATPGNLAAAQSVLFSQLRHSAPSLVLDETDHVYEAQLDDPM